MAKEKVLIVGGGFAGVKAALELSDDERFEVSILSNKDNFTYYPTLYHVATGGNKASSSIPLKAIFKDKKVKIAIGEAESLDRKTKTLLTLTNESYSYDTLVLAMGVVTNYFNIPGLAELSYGVKSVEEVEHLKAHLHEQLISDQRADLNYVIVGAGPTGIELAGVLPEYLNLLMKQHKIRDKNFHVDLVEASPRLLPKLPKDTSSTIKKRLQRKGIRLFMGKVVQGETANALTISGKAIQSHTVIWTAGTSNHPFFQNNSFVITSTHKVATDVFLQADQDIFVLGDNANTPYSGMAQTGVYDGIFLARNLKRRASGKDMKAYIPEKPITVIPVGEGWAAVIYGKLRIYGWAGWLLRQAADARAFHDYEPWSMATKQWISYYDTEDECKICHPVMVPTPFNDPQT